MSFVISSNSLRICGGVSHHMRTAVKTASSVSFMKSTPHYRQMNSAGLQIVRWCCKSSPFGSRLPQRIQRTRHLNLNRSLSSAVKMKDWESNLDPVQRQLLEEECILLDNKDQVIGHDSKKNCHLIRENGDVLLHRAFSVFLFNSKGELLLQQRSSTKITFPDMWTNTCCSHPLFTPSELDEARGIKVAARRRLEFELGISPEDIKLEDFHYLTRIHYKALSNSIWGEHEIDYILFVQKDLPIRPNKDEVKEIKFVTLEEIKSMAEEGKELTPWFKLIYKSWLPLWWKNLGNLKPYEDHEKIHRM